MRKSATAEVIALDSVSNGGQDAISLTEPYIAKVTVEGSRAMLFHGWNIEAIEEKGAAKKGSAARKTDNLESYVYRDERGFIGIPGTYLHAAIKQVGRYRPDPRSPRKSSMDLYNEAIIMETDIASLGAKTWDFEHRGRAIVQRAAITRTWPAFKKGWRATFRLEVILPEYLPPDILNEAIALAGRIKGLGDYRPTFGRFNIVGFEVVSPN